MQLRDRLHLHLHLHDGVVGGGVRVGDNNRNSVVTRLHTQARFDGDGAVLDDGRPFRSTLTRLVSGSLWSLRGVLRGSGIRLLDLYVLVLRLEDVGVWLDLGGVQRVKRIRKARYVQARSLEKGFTGDALSVEHVWASNSPMAIRLPIGLGGLEFNFTGLLCLEFKLQRRKGKRYRIPGPTRLHHLVNGQNTVFQLGRKARINQLNIALHSESYSVGRCVAHLERWLITQIGKVFVLHL